MADKSAQALIDRKAEEILKMQREAKDNLAKTKTFTFSSNPYSGGSSSSSTSSTSTSSSSSSSSSSGKAPVVTKTVDIGINTMLKDIDLVDFSKVVLAFMTVSKSINGIEYTGGISPVKRFNMIMQYEAKLMDICTILKVTEVRGHKLSNFALKRDSSASTIKEAMKACKIAFPKAHAAQMGYTGIHSVVSVKVAMSPYMIKLREELGTPSFNGVEYNGICPLEYCWMGSLSSMYIKGEESISTPQDLADNIRKKVLMYEDFTNWYIKVRADAAELNNPSSNTSSKEEKEKSIMRNRAWYPTALASFSSDCRKSWLRSSGSYAPVVPKEGDRTIYSEEFVLDVIAQVFDVTVDELRAAKREVVKTDGTGAGAHKGSNVKK